jgi:hypothetical protein
MQSSAPRELSADTSPSLAEINHCVTSQVAVQRETVGKEEFRPMSTCDKPADLSALSDEDLQDYIHACAKRFLAAQERWEATGEFSAIGDRDRYWGWEAEALRERGSRPHLVARLEQERGLA